MPHRSSNRPQYSWQSLGRMGTLDVRNCHLQLCLPRDLYPKTQLQPDQNFKAKKEKNLFLSPVNLTNRENKLFVIKLYSSSDFCFFLKIIFLVCGSVTKQLYCLCVKINVERTGEAIELKDLFEKH